MEDGIDFSSIQRDRTELQRLSSDRYWDEFNGDWKSYLQDVFKYDDAPPSVEKPFRIKVKEKEHPFVNWI